MDCTSYTANRRFGVYLFRHDGWLYTEDEYQARDKDQHEGRTTSETHYKLPLTLWWRACRTTCACARE